MAEQTAKKVLYNKYRPKKLSELIGQDTIVKTLENAVKSDRISHAYLFTGVRGTGKTTLARIMARILNCTDGPSTAYSDDDPIIQEINSGTFPDIYELDAATNRSIDNIRDIRANAYKAPIRGRKKVFIIDEVHCLNETAASPLLKILEEPPEHAVFVLCTTDPQKLISTIHSRCQRYRLKKISQSEMVSHLSDICKKEGVSSIEKGSIEIIANSSNGSLRDAISILDAVIGRCGEKITVQEVSDIVGVSPQDVVFEILARIFTPTGGGALIKAEEAVQEGSDATYIFNTMLEMLHDIMVSKAMAKVRENFLVPNESLKERWLKLRDKVPYEQMKAVMDIVNENINNLSFMPRPELILNVAILDMAKAVEKMKEKSIAS